MNSTEEKPTKSATGKRKRFTIKDFLHGKILESPFLKKNIPFMIYMVFVALIYIDNRFRVELLLKEQIALSNEIKELKYEAITTSSELMKKSRQSEVVNKVQEHNIGLEVLTTPPRPIKVKQ
ncbi:MAG: FtsL-like putative cell division protein [Marinilabiliaceae bacterium]|nr:FtsL-like putative cell division protein [Marinilabiliaceae bacterium]